MERVAADWRRRGDAVEGPSSAGPAVPPAASRRGSLEQEQAASVAASATRDATSGRALGALGGPGSSRLNEEEERSSAAAAALQAKEGGAELEVISAVAAGVTAGSPTLRFRAQVAGEWGVALVDSGASLNFVGAEFVRRLPTSQVTIVPFERWEGFLGERKEGQKAMFIVRRSSIIAHSGMSVQVYKNPGEEYEIEGSCWSRSCTVIDAARRAVVRRSGGRGGDAGIVICAFPSYLPAQRTNFCFRFPSSFSSDFNHLFCCRRRQQMKAMMMRSSRRLVERQFSRIKALPFSSQTQPRSMTKSASLSSLPNKTLLKPFSPSSCLSPCSLIKRLTASSDFPPVHLPPRFLTTTSSSAESEGSDGGGREDSDDPISCNPSPARVFEALVT
ncbi:unnamed protein product [Linum tenue]|uniref:Uncharacterized protein n=1 Tax=Linum tenue TaxID=586396 RepID=A0AAV0I240_9ROSI|nr:unnamed protein product [Linum tenue]